jgi:hypothetical protein
MIRKISNRRFIEPQGLRSIVKADKSLAKRTRKLMKEEDLNRRLEDQNTFQSLIPSVASSQIKSLSDN